MITVLSREEYSDILVTVLHPWGDVVTTLDTWIRIGPGPRPYVRINNPRRISTGESISMDEIPLEYHNSREARTLQRQGLLPCPWGPPAAEEPGERYQAARQDRPGERRARREADG